MADEVILLFSGGRDSFLSACYLIEKGFKVYIVTFDNGAGLQAYNVEHATRRIIKRYGKNNAEFLGIHCIAGIWREFFLPYFNMKPSEIINEYGELTISQFHCLTCRSSMYIWSVIKAQQMKIRNVADGARKHEGFAIQQPTMISKFKKLFSEYSIQLLLPVYDLDSDWKRKNLLLLKGFVPKTLEPQCLVGVPLRERKPTSKQVQRAVGHFFDKVILPRAREIIRTEGHSILDSEGEI